MNKKGFTLAELLGVIVILLLLVLIVTPLAMNYSKKASDSVYDIQIKTIKDSAREWSSDKENTPLIPTEDNGCIEVSLEKLKEAGYLDYNIKNPKTNEKFDDNLTVIIRREGKNLTYTFNEDGTQVCDTVVTTDYPKWVYVSSNPHLASSSTEVTVNIESNKKIIEYNLLPENIQVKVGSTINENANITVYCNNGTKLSCELKLSNLEGDGRLTLVIDKDVMKDEDLNPSRKTNLLTDTIVDSKGPIISYTGRTNTNPSTYYATKDDTVEIKFKAEDEQGIVNNLTKDDLKIYLDGVEITCGKELTTTGSGNTLNYNLKLTNVTGTGKLSIKIPSGKVADTLGNTNNDKTITPGITFDNVKPIITFDPNEEARYLQSITPMIFVTDNETGVDDSTIKYIISTDPNATPNTSISNGGEITISGLTGNYYIIGYACDYAGNCSQTPSGIYHMNNAGPLIEISPNSNAGYARTANIKIIVTARGAALDEGSFVYTISTDINATPTDTFINNTNLNIPALTGIYYINAKACDMDGNCSEAVSNKYYFDNQAPEITYNPNGTYNSGSYYWTKNLDVAIRVTDNIELDWSKYVVDTSKTADPSTGTGIDNGELTFKPDANPTKTGIYYIVVKACDKLGNCAQSNSNKYQFDNEKPGIGNITVTPNATTKKITSTVTITDNVALSKYEIYDPSGAKVVEQTISGTSYNVSYEQNTAGTYKIKVYDHLNNANEKTFVIPSYTVTFKSNNNNYGTVSPTSATVNYGANATTTATAKSGYHYKSVSCTNSQSASHNSGTVTAGPITSNTTCTVTFEINSYEVTFKSSDTNKGTVSPTKVNVNHNGSGTSTASPATGYYTSSVSGTNCSLSGNTITASSVTSARTCTVNFDKNSYPVTFTVNNSSMGSVTPTIVTVAYNESGSATFTANSGYKYNSVSGTGCSVSGNKVTASNVTSARTCTVNFVNDTYTITYNLNGGTNNSSNPGSYTSSSGAITLKSPTRSGYAFAGWTGSNGSTPQTSVTIASGSTGNKTYTANWKALPQGTLYIYEPKISETSATFSVIIPWQDVTSDTKYQYSIDGGANWSNCTNFDSAGCCKVDLSLTNKNDVKRLKTRYYDSVSKATSATSDEYIMDPARLYIWQLWQGMALYDEAGETVQIGTYRVMPHSAADVNSVYNNNYLTQYSGKMGELAIGWYIYGDPIMYFHGVSNSYKKLNIIYRAVLGRTADTGTIWEDFLNNRGEFQYYMINYGDDPNFTGVCVDMSIAFVLVSIAESGEANNLYDNWGLGRADRTLPGIPACVQNNDCSAYSSNATNPNHPVANCFGPNHILQYEWEKSNSQFKY